MRKNPRIFRTEAVMSRSIAQCISQPQRMPIPIAIRMPCSLTDVSSPTTAHVLRMGRGGSAMLRMILAVLVLLAPSQMFFAQAIPKADVRGSKDSPLLKRYEGSVIVAYEYKAYDELALPLSKLERVPGKT